MLSFFGPVLFDKDKKNSTITLKSLSQSNRKERNQKKCWCTKYPTLGTPNGLRVVHFSSGCNIQLSLEQNLIAPYLKTCRQTRQPTAFA